MVLVGSNEPLSISSTGMIEVVETARMASNGVSGLLNSNLTVWSSTAITSLTEASCRPHTVPRLGSSKRLNDPTTSLAVSGRPLEKAASARSLNSYEVGEVCSQDSANCGFGLRSSPVETSRS